MKTTTLLLALATLTLGACDGTALPGEDVADPAQIVAPLPVVPATPMQPGGCVGATPSDSVDMYSAPGPAGECVRVSIPSGQTTAEFNQSAIAVLIQSLILGPHMKATFCPNPPGPGFSCPEGGEGIGNDNSAPSQVTSWDALGRPGFMPVAFQLARYPY